MDTTKRGQRPARHTKDVHQGAGAKSQGHQRRHQPARPSTYRAHDEGTLNLALQRTPCARRAAIRRGPTRRESSDNTAARVASPALLQGTSVHRMSGSVVNMHHHDAHHPCHHAPAHMFNPWATPFYPTHRPNLNPLAPPFMPNTFAYPLGFNPVTVHHQTQDTTMLNPLATPFHPTRRPTLNPLAPPFVPVTYTDVQLFGVPRSMAIQTVKLVLADSDLVWLCTGRMQWAREYIRITLQYPLTGGTIRTLSHNLRKIFGWRLRPVIFTYAPSHSHAPNMQRHTNQPYLPTPHPVPQSLPTAMPRGLKLATLNCRSLTSDVKQLELQDVMQRQHIDILAVQETWERVGAAGYNDLLVQSTTTHTWMGKPRQRAGRTSARADGGIGFFVHNAIVDSCTLLSDTRMPDSAWLKVAGAHTQRALYIACVYMPVDGSGAEVLDAAYEQLAVDIQRFNALGRVILLGDFNARVGRAAAPDQVIGQFGEPTQNAAGSRLQHLLTDSDLYMLNGRCPGSVQYTWHRACDGQSQRTVIDYVIADKHMVFEQMSPLQVHHGILQSADHSLLCTVLPQAVRRTRVRAAKPVPQLKYRLDLFQEEGYIEQYQAQLNASLHTFLGAMAEPLPVENCRGEIDSRATQLSNIITAAADASIGKKRIIPGRAVPWWTPALRQLIQTRRELYQQLVAAMPAVTGTTPPSDLLERWRAASQAVKLHVRQAKRNFWRRYTHRLGEEYDQIKKKRFWDILKWRRFPWRSDLIPSPMHVTRVKTRAGTTTSEPHAMADAFRHHYHTLGDPAQLASAGFDSEHYTAVCSAMPTILASECEDGDTNAALNAPITAEEVRKAKRRLHNRKACGQDQIFGEFLKYGSGMLDEALAKFFNMCFDSETMATQLRRGTIISLYKGKGEHSDPNNYRGITIMSVLGKLFCKVLNERLLGYLESKDLLHEGQSGFRTGRGCIDNLHTLANLTRHRRHRRAPTYAFFLDVRKAYDVVWREGLWYKLHAKGVRGKLLRFIVDMYAVTRCTAMVNGVRSDEFCIHQGVAQGCVLSTTLYDVFVDDLLREVHALQEGIPVGHGQRVAALMQADDYVGLTAEPTQLQRNINACYTYSLKWRFQANITKSAVLIFAKKHSPIVHNDLVFKWGQTCIPVVSEYRYLGVQFHESCDFTEHIDQIRAKARQRARALSAIFTDRMLHTHLKQQVYKSVVRPVLEYGVEAWGCRTQKEVEQLEAVQSMVCRMILNAPHWAPVRAMRLELGLESLQHRWDQLRLGWQQKVFRMCVDAPGKRWPGIVYAHVNGECKDVMPRVMYDLWASLPSAQEHHWGDRESDNRRVLLGMPHGAFIGRIKKELWMRELQSYRNELEKQRPSQEGPRETSQYLMAVTLECPATAKELPAKKTMQRYLRHANLDSGCSLQFQFKSGAIPLRTQPALKRMPRHPRYCSSEQCPCCGGQRETLEHVLLECHQYGQVRQQLLDTLRAQFPSDFDKWSALSLREQAGWLLADKFWVHRREQGDEEVDAEMVHHMVQRFLLAVWRAREVAVQGSEAV